MSYLSTFAYQLDSQLTYTVLCPSRVGSVCKKQLFEAGIETIEAVQRTEPYRLIKILGERKAKEVKDASFGIDHRIVAKAAAFKTLSVEESFRECRTWSKSRTLIQLLCEDLIKLSRDDEKEVCISTWLYSTCLLYVQS